jgi:hypothetical protein
MAVTSTFWPLAGLPVSAVVAGVDTGVGIEAVLGVEAGVGVETGGGVEAGVEVVGLG